jgi:hypothetical protein
MQSEPRGFQQVPPRYRFDAPESGRSRYQIPAPSDQPGAPSLRSGRIETPRGGDAAPRMQRSFERSSDDRSNRSSQGNVDRSGGRSSRGRDRDDD